MDVPELVAVCSCNITFEPSTIKIVPTSLSCGLVFISTCATAAILAMASPRKPNVYNENKSSIFLILDVAWRSKHIRASVSLMPQPSSTTCISARPASFIINCTLLAPESTLFSSNSFTTEAGR